MADSTSSPCTSCVVQVPKSPVEINWVEAVHGFESIATIIALGIGAWWAWRNDFIKTMADRRAERELRERERKQRDNQLAEQQRNREWEQTKIARQINEQFMDDLEARQATALIDSDGDSYTVSGFKMSSTPFTYNFREQEDVHALRIDEKVPLVDKDVFLRACFDSWFYWMAAMEQYLQNGLIRQKDMAFPSDYYLRYLRKDNALYAACINYVIRYQLSLKVLEFMTRFENADGDAAGAASMALSRARSGS
jgi:hypothetical protein